MMLNSMENTTFCESTENREKHGKTFLVAITGGIGSGKSTAAKALEEAGYTVFYCDKVVCELYKNPNFNRKLKKFFPSAVKGFLFPKVNKSELSDVTLFDDENYKILTKVVTEAVYEKVMKRARRKKGLVFIEIPLLFEYDKQGDFDRVIVIMRDEESREKGVMARSGLKKSQIAARMARQVDYKKLDLTPYRVIKNDKTEEDLRNSVLSLAKAIELEMTHDKSADKK